MPQSHAQILLHLVFSTKDRMPLILPHFRDSLYGMMASVLARLDSPAIRIGGTSDHIHVLFAADKNRALKDVVRDAKANTSKWVNDERLIKEEFHWQAGYGAFSVSQSNVSRVLRYIDSQEEHHKKWTFQNEFRALLKKHKIEYDERYIWD